jgi:hypothetical protein
MNFLPPPKVLSNYRPMKAIKREASSEDKSEFGIRIYDGVFGRTDIFPLTNTKDNLTRWHFGSSDLVLKHFSIEDWDYGEAPKKPKMWSRFEGKVDLARSKSLPWQSKRIVTEAGIKKLNFYQKSHLNEFSVIIEPKNNYDDFDSDFVGLGALELGQSSCELELRIRQEFYDEFAESFKNGSAKYVWAQLSQTEFPRDLSEHLQVWEATNAYGKYIVPDELLKSGHIANAEIFPKNIESAFCGRRSMMGANATVSVKVDQIGWSSK